MAIITTVKERINRLNPASFQILCDALLSKEGYDGIVALGTEEGTEKITKGTPDTYFCLPGGKYAFAEYTTQKVGLPAKIYKDIDKCVDEKHTNIPIGEITEIIICHTSSNISPGDDRSLKSYCQSKGLKLTLLGIDLLAEKLMNYPSIIKDHLGLTIDSEQIQSVDDFIRQYDSNALVAPLKTKFLFREKEIEAIDKAYEKVRVVLLVGPAGTGKTRLALEYSKSHAETQNERFLCIHDRSLPMYEDLKLYFEKPGDYFIFVDDANQLSKLKHIVEYVNKSDQGYNVHILMSVRDYAVSKVKADINGIINYEIVTIGPFSDEEITTLMEKHYNILNPQYLRRIVQIAEGNPRIAMLAGKIACETNRLDSIKDVSDLYENYYGKVLYDSGIEVNDQLLISAGIMAFLYAIHLDHIDAFLPILEQNNLSKTDFEKALHTLHEYEIVDICNDKAVRFSEQCMANFVLKYVFFDKKRIKLSSMIEACFVTHHNRTVHAVSTLLEYFGNHNIQEYVKSEIMLIWKKLDNEHSPVFFEYLKTFYPVNELQTLLLLQEHIDVESSVIMKAEEINTPDRKNYQNITDDIIIILGGFSYLENLEAALDLYFEYLLKRPDLYMQFVNSATSYYSIDIYSAQYGYRTQILFFTKTLQYIKHGGDPLITKLFLDVASHFLQLEFSPIETSRNGNGVTLFHIPLSLSAGVKKYRKIIWELLMELSSKEQYLSKIRSILNSYGKTLHDCSKEVIAFEAEYILNLSNRVLSAENLEDCLIAQSIQAVFDKVEYQSFGLQPFLSSSKYKLYQIITGINLGLVFSYEEQKQRKKERIRLYMSDAEDKSTAFTGVLQLLYESNTLNNINYNEIAEAINIALQVLADSKVDYLNCVKKVLGSEVIIGIDTYSIVNTLFSIFKPTEVYDLIINCCRKHRNAWSFAYYREIPQKDINQSVLEALYSVLLDESDRAYVSSPYRRDISFLEKYLPVDRDVFLNASEIIFKKKEYSPSIVSLYFEPLFNEFNIQPKHVVQQFARDIKLLEQIYLYVIENSYLTDYHGSFLRELISVDKSFIKEYVRSFVAKIERHISHDDPKTDVFFIEDDYLDSLDYIIDYACVSSEYPSLTVPQIIKTLISIGDKKYSAKTDCWIKHLIETNYMDKTKMQYLFTALIEVSIDRAYNYIPLIISYTDDYDIFKSIPLIPLSYSYSGSCVPLYYSWVEHLENILPIFSGSRYIKHKNRVQKYVDRYRENIKKEEISDILNG